jgi:carotenoid cleavage dioxygenase
MSQGAASPLDEGTLRRWFVNAWRPTTNEERYRLSEIHGEIPREIFGTLYRNGPCQNVLPKDGYEALHLFDGDGLVHAFRFEDGRIDYTGRFVRSESFLAEQEEGRYCLTGVGLRVENPIERVAIRQQPNTNVVHHAGRLFALVENAPPFELDRRTLESRGWWNLGGRMLGYATSAHPRIDVATGQMILHGYQPWPPYVQYYVIDADGTCPLAEAVEVPYGMMMHDVAITEHHVIFPLCPVLIDAQTLLQGGTFADALRWEPERGLRFGIRPREAGGAVQWFEAPSPGYLFHFGNAYEEDGRLVVDACTYPDGAGLLQGLRTLRRGDFGREATAYPYLYEFDLHTGSCHEHQLDDRGAEFPRLDDRRVGRRNRYGYAVTSRERPKTPHEAFFSVLVQYDRQGGASRYQRLERGHWSSEPVFVPREPTAEEDDGFVLSVVYEGPIDRSYLLILDARDFAGPPLARAYLRQRIPMGFHGNFAAGAT